MYQDSYRSDVLANHHGFLELQKGDVIGQCRFVIFRVGDDSLHADVFLRSFLFGSVEVACDETPKRAPLNDRNTRHVVQSG